ncbi:glycoside hydrolase family 18 protein [Deinococcus alpinitundrae]|uniref:glycoside hydrolase family 18 protein n=1 Tax=Deinococcus alpinitundrae TaxID=468913 RepID=UPI001379CD10|nr:glycoside hydrolase family 18 protein [Deinococcus alpinitundrae]
MPRPAPLSIVALSLILALGACAGSSGSPSTPSSTTPPDTTNTGSGAWVMGYAVGYERDLLPPSELNWASLTHLAVGRATPNADGSLNTTFDIDAVSGPAWAKTMVQQAHAHNVKAILMLGGAGEHAGFVSAASASKRQAFVQNILKVVQGYGFDGVDLDWEPIESADQAPLKALAVALKAAQPNLLLSVPINFVNSNFPRGEARPSFADLAQTVDRLNIMSYGMAGIYEGWKSWHSSALMGESESTPSSVDSSVKAYLAAGVPASKLGLGIGFYGLCYQGVSGPRQTAPGMKIAADDGQMSYSNIMAGYFTPAARKWDDSAKVPYLSSATPLGMDKCSFVSYEDAQSIAEKGRYAREKGLGGTIVWTLGQAHFSSKPAGQRDPLLDAVKSAFRP